MRRGLECRLLCPDLAGVVCCFFARLQKSGVETFFHPHAFTAEEARRLTLHQGKDLYYALLLDQQMIGYGMLRGWDDGFDVPSLGIVIDPANQGQGLGRLLMQFLHCAARARGAHMVRLKVYPENERALQTYRSLGYQFDDTEAGQLVGTLRLGNPPQRKPAR